eukprot:TRINITY_DN46601_c0_g1_i1.p1 TRINITY_DN46601_c0_g1~~TRINITY_DN46601_c0_g1_i1.p1  ORF type:complete len:194 (-),score=47.85 TRINITY_DN46601_c0_g1_i1:203-784(-)
MAIRARANASKRPGKGKAKAKAKVRAKPMKAMKVAAKAATYGVRVKEEQEDGEDNKAIVPLGARKRAAKGTVAHQSNYKRKGWAKRLVFIGKKVKTTSGLTKDDLVRNRRGKVVSKKRQTNGNRRFVLNHLDLWVQSFLQVRAQKGLTGFVKMKYKGTAQEKAICKEVRAMWDAKKAQRTHKIEAAPSAKEED